ncbi:Rv0909 family putative TA system antitoxin [Klenkia sp. PcliD-1-E]|uniref:Rv0909 family putative TA system antitoxin n=1 Tax=Klenkia sp. PcliD-1-E TaxID=2954492 RepID=UPI002097BFD5|nr:Rv0909 family putative TA system antitoxin [Klenkia sp. PcliD-1-E]MCO7219345.1 Rv0909 family putative TA system antitoxin [Klenkia sp. PcliD-1-E]
MPVGARGALPGWLAAADLDPAWVAGALADTGNGGRPGGITNLPVPGRQPRALVAVGVGDATPAHLRSYVAIAVRRAQTLAEHGATRLVLPLPAGADPEAVRVAAEAVLLAGYRFRLTSAPHPPRLTRVVLVVPGAGPVAVDALHRGLVTAAAVLWARDLVNTPPDTADPAWVAEQARDRFAVHDRVGTTVLGPRQLRAAGFGGLLAVGGGSDRPPRLVLATYVPATALRPHVVLVGKGITFDTGGISIKTTAGMRYMHTDMAGGAAVLAVLDAVARLALPVRVTALVPLAENSVSGAAYRPGDVLTHVGGRTTEVRSTDAEGRLVLADALAHARLELAADVLVDVATLTGAARTALGARTGALFTTDDTLAADLLAGGAAAGEPWWRMPLTEEHVGHLRAQLDSPVADANNSPGAPGATTAALFLQPFTGGLRWAHLDVAGPARAAGDAAEVVKGGTGFTVRTLLRWLEAGVSDPARPGTGEGGAAPPGVTGSAAHSGRRGGDIMAGLGDKAKDFLNSDKGEQASDSALDKGAEFAEGRAGGHADQIDKGRDALDDRIGSGGDER